MFLDLNIAEFLKTIATNCSEGLAWLLGVLGSVGLGTIIGAIVAIVKSKIQSKQLIDSVNKGNQTNTEYIKESIIKFKTEIDEILDKTKNEVAKYGSDNAIISELLLMIASKVGFSTDEIVKVANKYKELPTSSSDVADNVINDVKDINKQKEYEKLEQEENQLHIIKQTETALNELEIKDLNNLSNEDKTSKNELKISL